MTRNKSKRFSSQPAAGRNIRDVVRVPGGWTIKDGGSGRASGIYETQAEAERIAKEQVRISGGEVRVETRAGRWRASFTVGRQAYAKISAVEGISLSPDMQRDLRNFDRKALSDEERRAAIMKKYGMKRA
jgi:hypothetical protein